MYETLPRKKKSKRNTKENKRVDLGPFVTSKVIFRPLPMNPLHHGGHVFKPLL